MTKFYDWQKTFSYNAPVTIVVGARGIGKTFGLRLQCIRDFIKDGTRFVEAFRYKDEMKSAVRGYFDRLAQLEELAGYEFKSDMSGGYIREKGAKEWQRVAYFVPLTRAQAAKQDTFARVRRIFFDEFIIDKTNRYGRYLPNEGSLYSGLVDTVTRQQAGDGQQPKAYLLGNALDLVNPYFTALGITEIPPAGYHWKAGKRVLLHMVPRTAAAAKAKADETLAGQMMDIFGSKADREASHANAFTIVGESFIVKGQKVKAPMASIIWHGHAFTVWAREAKNGLLAAEYHVREGIAPECEAAGRAFYFSRSDARIDYRAAKRGERGLAWLAPVFQAGRITFETPELFETFTQVLSYFSLAV